MITISGDGTGALLKANVVGGHVVDVVIQNRGSDYTYAALTFDDSISPLNGTGSGATANVAISPRDGHGYDPIEELGASTIIFNVEFKQDESVDLPTASIAFCVLAK